jgi:DNA-binding NarL/FixJ family response regulator
MGENEKILIIDDEPDFVEAFQRTLEDKSYQVIKASSKAEAEEMIKTDPDVIALGTIAPAGQAFATYQWLIEHPKYKDIPLLVIDARYEERLSRGWRRFEAVRLDSDAYVSKPVEPALLVPIIKNLLVEVPRRAGKIRILVTDDHTMVRDGVCAVLALQKDMEVIGEATNGKEALEKVQRLLPDVALMDIVMPVMGGLEATRHISSEHPHIKVLILTQYDEEENMLVAKETGAYGFVPKKAASSELLDAIRCVAGGKCFPPGFGEMVTA